MAMSVTEYRAWIRFLYQDLLLRSPSSGELDFWAGVYKQKGAESVITGIIDSKEGRMVRNKRRRSIGLGAI